MVDWTTLTLHLIHILAGVFWAGAVFFLARFLMPALKSSGPGGQKVLQELFAKQKVGIVLPVAGLLTVLSGFAMYASNVSASSGVWAHSRPAMVYGAGGVAAVIALLAGGSMVGPSLGKVVKIQLAAQAAGRELSRDETDSIGRLQARAALGTKIATTALLVAVVTMAIGRYV